MQEKVGAAAGVVAGAAGAVVAPVAGAVVAPAMNAVKVMSKGEACGLGAAGQYRRWAGQARVRALLLVGYIEVMQADPCWASVPVAGVCKASSGAERVQGAWRLLEIGGV